MAASPQVVTNNPLFLNSRTLVYTATELRKQWDNGTQIGPGVCDLDSFRVRQRVAGATQSVDVVAASVLNRAWVRHTSNINDGVSASTDAGMYYVDYNNAAILNLDISAADPTNPRIDQIYLAIEDAQAAGANNQATVRVVTGTATGGATLDNRTGVGAAPAGMGFILLADILVPALSASVVTANIRDRRPFGVMGAIPGGITALDIVPLIPSAGLPVMMANGNSNTNAFLTASTHDNMQSACLVYLPRRIVNATRLRWKYLQGATAAATNYNIGIYDASMRSIVATGAVAFTGALNTIQPKSETIAATTFEAGYYWVLLGVAPMTASSTVQYAGVPCGVTGSVATANMIPLPGVTLTNATGSTTLPTTLAAFADMYQPTGGLNRPSVPLVALSVG